MKINFKLNREFGILFSIFFLVISMFGCESDKKEDKSSKEKIKTEPTPQFVGVVPVQDSVLVKPRKTSDGGFSYYPADPLFTLFVEDLKKWVETKNTTKISEFTYFPVACSLGGKPKDVHSPKDYARLFNEIFNAKVKKALNNTSQAENNFRNQYGYQIGTGEIWCAKFRNNKNEILYKITTINN